MIKLNRVLEDVKIPDDFKVYVNNYINESIKLMNEKGYINEFICEQKNVLNTLKQKSIIWEATYNEYGVLIPTKYNLSPVNKKAPTVYILNDYVFEKNGFKVVAQ